MGGITGWLGYQYLKPPEPPKSIIRSPLAKVGLGVAGLAAVGGAYCLKDRLACCEASGDAAPSKDPSDDPPPETPKEDPPRNGRMKKVLCEIKNLTAKFNKQLGRKGSTGSAVPGSDIQSTLQDGNEMLRGLNRRQSETQDQIEDRLNQLNN